MYDPITITATLTMILPLRVAPPCPIDISVPTRQVSGLLPKLEESNEVMADKSFKIYSPFFECN